MITRTVKEPLVHFLLIGGLIFAAFAYVDDTPPKPDTHQIIINQTDITTLSTRFESTWKRKPQPQELQSMTEDLIRERVLVAAALELGMDRNDAVINRRLRQKMDFFAASIAEAITPEVGELESFYQAHAEDYQTPPQFALEQIYLGERADAETITAALTALKGGADPDQLRHPSLLPQRFDLSPTQVLNNSFGRGFAESLDALPIGTWAGPVRSGYGLHLVRMTDKSATTLPGLDQVAHKVLPDWQNAKRQEVLEQYYQTLRGGYEIILPAQDPAS